MIGPQLRELLTPLARAAGLHPIIAGVNIGGADEFRVADGMLEREPSSGTWAASAALVFEIVSPGDDSWDKLPFYAAHQIDEVLIVDGSKRAVDWLALDPSDYVPVARSRLIDLGPARLQELIDWPALG